jgi:type I restriction enzyme, S subunit
MNGNGKLPTNWHLAVIDDITLPITKIDPKQFPDQKYLYLDISGIDNRQNRIVDHKVYLGKDAPSRARQLVQTDDILFSTVRTYLKNIAKVPRNFDGEVASTGFSILRAAEGIDSDFLFYFTLTPQFLNPLADLQRGTSYPAVRDSDVREQTIPLPPLPEQRRIVAKIEELFTELDAGIASLRTAQSQLKTYRQALLKHAFEGKLTGDWRAENADTLEPAAVLLRRIADERQARYDAEVAEWEAGGKTGRKPRALKDVPTLSAAELTDLPALPAGWAWVKVDALGEVQLGRQRSPKNRSKDFPTKYIRAANITENGLALTDVMDMEFTPDDFQRYQLKYGDILLSEASGSPDQVGKPALWRNQIPNCCFQNTIIRLRLLDSLNNEYFLLLFKNFYANSVFAKTASGVGINHLSANKFASLAAPLAPVNEQIQIVQEIDSRLSIIDQLEQTITTALQQAENLRQSILQKAFAGQLVPQDENDEPASVLLARIRAAK